MHLRPFARGLALIFVFCFPLLTSLPVQARQTPTPASPATPTLQPQPETIPLPPPAPLTASEALVYRPTLPAVTGCPASDEALLGAQAGCQPVTQPLRYRLDLPVEAGDAGAIVSLSLECSGANSCLSAANGDEENARFRLSAGEDTLWATGCTDDQTCASNGPNRTVQVTFRVPASGTYPLFFDLAPGSQWRIGQVRASLLPEPATAIRGYAYSPYRDCQTPHGGPHPTSDQIAEDIHRLRHSSNAIRTYSAREINAEIVQQAQQAGLHIGMGVWIDERQEKRSDNEKEIQAAQALARQVPPDFLIAGNEVILRSSYPSTPVQDRLTPAQLATYLRRVKQATRLPVAYADVAALFLSGANGPYPDPQPIVAAADVLLIHIYPYWDGVAIENGAGYVADLYQQVKNRYPDKRVIIGETGWPSRGAQNGAAIANIENQRRFFLEFTALAEQQSIDYFYFAPFEEPWKTAEGEVGPSWGIVTAARQNKFESESLFFSRPLPATPPTGSAASGTQPVIQPTGTASQQPPAAGTPPMTLYNDFPLPEKGLAPSWWSGDGNDVQFDVCWKTGAHSGRSAIRVEYNAASAANKGTGWAGMTWEYPLKNRGAKPQGMDLSAYQSLAFYARGEKGGERVSFTVGGTPGKYPSSIRPMLSLNLTLTDQWQKYTFDLSHVDRSHVIDGFAWVVSACKNPDGAVFYLDDIQYSTETVPPNSVDLHILDDGCVNPGFNLGVASSTGYTKWTANTPQGLEIAYPTRQTWGAVFLYPYRPLQTRQPTLDLSTYGSLHIRMRGTTGDENVRIGIKDKNDPDNGRETKIVTPLTSELTEYSYPLHKFVSADTTILEVLTEFVFEQQASAQTIYVDSIWYEP